MNTMKNNNEKINQSTIFLCIGISLFVFFIWFFPSLTRYWAFFLLGTNIIYLISRKNLTVKFDSTLILFLMFIMIVTFGLVKSGANTFDALQFLFSLCLFAMTYVLLISDSEWMRILLKMLLYTSLFFVIGSVLQLINPELILNINRMHLSNVLYDQAYVFYLNGALSGFTYQTGVNGYIITLCISIVFCAIFKEPDKRKKVLFGIVYLFLLYLIFLTQKRGFIVFNLLSSVFLIPKLTKYKFTSIIPIIMSIGIFAGILFNTDIGQDLILRSVSQGDLTTGRSSMFQIMWNDFIDAPIFGNGTYTTLDAVNAYNGHNIYLQVLRENGLFGFLILVLIVIINFWKTNKLMVVHKEIQFSQYMLSVSLYMQLIFIMWGMTGNPLYDNYPLIIYIVCIAVPSVIEKQLKSYSYKEIPNIKLSL